MRPTTGTTKGCRGRVSNAGVAAVVVTWNRRDLLAESLRALDAQTVPPRAVIVVDNASDDGTAQLLARDFPHVDVVRTRRNTGGAGGFAIGLRRALATPTEAVWLMDDDTVPEPEALAALVAARLGYVDPAHPSRPPALVASRVVWTDGRDHPMNTPRKKPGVRHAEVAAAEAILCVPVRSASFVSVLVDADLVRERGLPIADYFLWNDDFEYTTRLVRDRVGLWCPASVVVHKTSTFGSIATDPGERFFYEVRNKVWLFGRSHGLSPVEKAVYAASTVRRWVHTFARSPDRRTLWRGLRGGVTDAVRTRPADTAVLIDEATAPDPTPPTRGTEGRCG
ncbi:MAG: glycosyltransferase [Nocardioidaceae bacterium]|nr:glycosyltransferase [Nocardioidaceae bacterium]